ncbi:sulfur carrier protein ThiS [Azospirillum lipoferum]|uniref:Thiamine biosynthesis protein ThiS n=1 Tax=Azospirillum lipoferum (strain 4B) TaxID=862719 RepID=G7Z8F0_AZOL4|nr:sulfur carrier protein ThiS [Azospirillum lipoferum]CBS85720.1 thiamine biosynthesis protein ThiS [Azospirillum lipoferum 4B]
MSAVLHINGREEPLSAASVAELLAARGIAEGTPGVAVALNGAVVPRRRWHETPLQPGDSLEIVRPIQGG